MTQAETKIIRGILLQNRLWILRVSGKSVGGWCAISAYRVNHSLRQHGFNPILTLVVQGTVAHCFNQLDNSILDVTVEQFAKESKNKIVLTNKEDLEKIGRKYWFWGWRENFQEPYFVYTGVKAVLNEVKGWGKQSPQFVLNRIVFSDPEACKISA